MIARGIKVGFLPAGQMDYVEMPPHGSRHLSDRHLKRRNIVVRGRENGRERLDFCRLEMNRKIYIHRQSRFPVVHRCQRTRDHVTPAGLVHGADKQGEKIRCFHAGRSGPVPGEPAFRTKPDAGHGARQISTVELGPATPHHTECVDRLPYDATHQFAAGADVPRR